jgi:ParB-like chromosome segregation protein Spo0J
MARAAPPEVVGQVLAIPVAHIEVGARLRPVDPVWAAALGAVMAVEGQKTPIEVCRLPGKDGYLLISGAHRLEGARLQGWSTIRATVEDNNALERRAREVSENLWRKGLGPIDRAAFLAELIAVKKQQAGVDPDRDGRVMSAAARWQKALKAESSDATAMIAVAYGFTAEIGARVGLSERTIRDDLLLYRRLAPDVAARLRDHPISGNAGQLRALAKLSIEDQRATAELLLAGESRTVSDAQNVLEQKPKPTPDAKAWSAFVGSWTRMSAARRREALRELDQLGLPKGVRIVFEGDEG